MSEDFKTKAIELSCGESLQRATSLTGDAEINAVKSTCTAAMTTAYDTETAHLSDQQKDYFDHAFYTAIMRADQASKIAVMDEIRATRIPGTPKDQVLNRVRYNLARAQNTATCPPSAAAGSQICNQLQGFDLDGLNHRGIGALTSHLSSNARLVAGAPMSPTLRNYLSGLRITQPIIEREALRLYYEVIGKNPLVDIDQVAAAVGTYAQAQVATITAAGATGTPAATAAQNTAEDIMIASYVFKAESTPAFKNITPLYARPDAIGLPAGEFPKELKVQLRVLFDQAFSEYLKNPDAHAAFETPANQVPMHTSLIDPFIAAVKKVVEDNSIKNAAGLSEKLKDFKVEAVKVDTTPGAPATAGGATTPPTYEAREVVLGYAKEPSALPNWLHTPFMQPTSLELKLRPGSFSALVSVNAEAVFKDVDVPVVGPGKVGAGLQLSAGASPAELDMPARLVGDQPGNSPGSALKGAYLYYKKETVVEKDKSLEPQDQRKNSRQLKLGLVGGTLGMALQMVNWGGEKNKPGQWLLVPEVGAGLALASASLIPSEDPTNKPQFKTGDIFWQFKLIGGGILWANETGKKNGIESPGSVSLSLEGQGKFKCVNSIGNCVIGAAENPTSVSLEGGPKVTVQPTKADKIEPALGVEYGVAFGGAPTPSDQSYNNLKVGVRVDGEHAMQGRIGGAQATFLYSAEGYHSSSGTQRFGQTTGSGTDIDGPPRPGLPGANEIWIPGNDHFGLGASAGIRAGGITFKLGGLFLRPTLPGSEWTPFLTFNVGVEN